MENKRHMNFRENKIMSSLGNLSKVNAPEDFEEKLFAKISQFDSEEQSSSQKQSLWIPSLSTAAGIAIAFYVLNVFQPSIIDTSTNLETPQAQVESKETTTPDSLKKEPENRFIQKPVLVKDSK